MRPAREKRLLQLVVGLACLVPLAAGAMGVIEGPAWLRGVDAGAPDLESHFRYLSGLLFAVGIGFASCIPAIERRSARFRLLGAIVVAGGLARLLSLAMLGPPSAGHILGLVMELGVVPWLMAWQARFAGRWAAADLAGRPGAQN